MTSVAMNRRRRWFTGTSEMVEPDFDEPEMFVAWLREQAFEGHLGDAVVPEPSTWQCDPPPKVTPERPRREGPPQYWEPLQAGRASPPPPPPLSPRDHIEAAAQFRALGMEEEARIAERLEQDRIACERYR